MTAIPFRSFTGEIPHLPAHELPEGHAQFVSNADLQHAEVRGLRANSVFATTTLSAAVRAVWTDDGANFYAWPYETYVVKSMVVNDAHFRIYYTAMLADGPIIKVGRTRRDDGTPGGRQVIGTALVGGNFQPPENSGGDAVILGVPAPRAQGVADTDQLAVTLVDKLSWPGSPKLQLKATYFLEAPDGSIVASVDITNTEAGIGRNGVTYPQVIYTNSELMSDRGNKIQDLLWSLNGRPTSTPAPYKYYFFLPPTLATLKLSRTVVVTNSAVSGNIVITYGGSAVPDVTPVDTNIRDSGA